MNLATRIFNEVDDLVGRFDSRDPSILASELGIYLSYRDLGQLKGFYWQVAGERHIVLNQALDDSVSNLVLAHELGHDRLHQELSNNLPIIDGNLYGSNSRTEYEANLFAAELLLTDHKVLHYLPYHNDLYSLARNLQVHSACLNFKLLGMQKRGLTKLNITPVNADFLKN